MLNDVEYIEMERRTHVSSSTVECTQVGLYISSHRVMVGQLEVRWALLTSSLLDCSSARKWALYMS